MPVQLREQGHARPPDLLAAAGQSTPTADLHQQVLDLSEACHGSLFFHRGLIDKLPQPGSGTSDFMCPSGSRMTEYPAAGFSFKQRLDIH